MDKWLLYVKDVKGGIGYEVWKENNGNRFYVKVYVYDVLVKLSGEPETLERKTSELYDLFSEVFSLVYEGKIKQNLGTKWETVRKGEVGRFFYQLLSKNSGYWLKAFIYDSKIEISGKDKITFLKKTGELVEVFEFVSDLFKNLSEPAIDF